MSIGHFRPVNIVVSRYGSNYILIFAHFYHEKDLTIKCNHLAFLSNYIIELKAIYQNSPAYIDTTT